MKGIKQERAITLIALVITVIVLLILAGVTLIMLAGNNGIIAKSKRAVIQTKKLQYFEEIKLEIYQEQIERQETAKKEVFITSINNRINQKDWVNSTVKCDEYFEQKVNDYENTILLIETKDNYEIIVEIDNVTLTAKIRENYLEIAKEKCQILYDANSGNGEIQKQQIRKGFYAILPSNYYTKENYKFVGWCRDKEGKSEIYVEGSRLKIEENITLYAIWESEIVTITFNANGGDGTMTSVNVKKDSSIKLTPNTFARIGYDFLNWTIDANGTETSYKDEMVITVNKDIELFAQWKARDITWAECKTELMTKQEINTTMYDGHGNKIVIPAGFKIALGNYVTEGIVIQDAKGNQFVWVPVGKIYKNAAKTAYETIQLNRYDFGESGTTRTAKGDASITWNGKKFEEKTTAASTNQAVAKDLTGFKNGVSKNNGYYIARYEASSSDSTIVSKANQNPYCSVTPARAGTLCRNMYTSKKFETDIMNSYAWDTTIIFIEKFGTNKDYAHARGSLQKSVKTGNTGDVQCNIYEIASNWREYTTETCTYSTTGGTSTPCTYRGGTYSTASWDQATRGEWNGAAWSIAFRPIIYIKE